MIKLNAEIIFESLITYHVALIFNWRINLKLTLNKLGNQYKII